MTSSHIKKKRIKQNKTKQPQSSFQLWCEQGWLIDQTYKMLFAKQVGITRTKQILILVQNAYSREKYKWYKTYHNDTFYTL